ncbi:MAG: ferrous iron transport protein B [Gammaproteobacteria bacterium]|nr:ferrous iron transport protein B [Gammaproteobacteria bacterium]MCP5198611.1 ferrous iron transport protein B [Gammaproteobacteria bacterium]
MTVSAVASPPVVVTIGNPNTGKSTLFNALTGLRQKVGNYPGVTVEQVSGSARLGEREIRLVDVPGTYSLAATSPDEIIAVDVLAGDIVDLPPPAAVIVVVDATNLRRNLFLLTQVLEAAVPVVVALNMTDRLAATGVSLDHAELERRLGVPVVPIVAAEGRGIDDVRDAVAVQLDTPRIADLAINPRLDAAVAMLTKELAKDPLPARHLEVRRALIDVGGYAEQRLVARHGEAVRARLEALRSDIGSGRNLATLEARDRYSYIQGLLDGVEQRSEVTRERARDLADAVLNHPLSGTAIFVLVMALVFQAVFAWAGPLVDGIDYLTGACGEAATALLGNGLVGSFVADGVIAGVGSVVVFLPQILILFAFIIVLEDTGYMARAAFLMDRVMRGIGLSGQAFIPMLSSFACAVPGIMGTRIIANRHDRLATILAAPFMTCSARLPVYSLLIAAFVPDTRYAGGLLNLQGLVLLALYLLGILGAALTAWLVSRLYWRRPRSRFLLEMPPYRMPSLRAVLLKLLSRALIFLRRAGTIIFAVTIVIWMLASFPRAHAPTTAAVAAPPTLENSYLGRLGHGIAPLFAPLGWDWKVTAAVLASFPAREVVIAALGTIYAVDTEAEDGTTTLTGRIREARHPDGSLVYTLPMVLGLLIFYAYCLQCVSTVAVMRRETGTWRWPLVAWCYMTALGYGGAYVAYTAGNALLVA